MTRDEYLEFFNKCCEEMKALTAKKNSDYSGGSGDPFFNFTRIESIGIASTEQGFLTRMFDKFARISTFVQKGVLQVPDESIEDTLKDLATYSLLFLGYIKHKKELAAKEAEKLRSWEISSKLAGGAQ
jgi:hypothetical protein